MTGYSKAPRGLSVQLRVVRVFTNTTTSPSPWSRQRSSRYTIRAGRNLPDKEFRYLRTVIVTAAVHRGFGSVLAHPPLTFRHWAGVSPYTSPCGLAETCVFVKQSLEPILCDLLRLPLCRVTLPRHPFFRSYGVRLPSSLTRVPSRALARCVPAYLCRFAVRARRDLTSQLFLAAWAEPLRGAVTPRSHSRLGVNEAPDLPNASPYLLGPAQPVAGRSTLLRPHDADNDLGAGPECQPAVHRLRLSASP